MGALPPFPPPPTTTGYVDVVVTVKALLVECGVPGMFVLKPPAPPPPPVESPPPPPPAITRYSIVFGKSGSVDNVLTAKAPDDVKICALYTSELTV